MKRWHNMELGDTKGFGWNGQYLLYELTIDGWNENEDVVDRETLVTVCLTMDPHTAERVFDIAFHHKKIETNIHLMRLVEIAIDVLFNDSRVDLDEHVRAIDPLFSLFNGEEEE